MAPRPSMNLVPGAVIADWHAGVAAFLGYLGKDWHASVSIILGKLAKSSRRPPVPGPIAKC
jgi:hypothetical protein